MVAAIVVLVVEVSESREQALSSWKLRTAAINSASVEVFSRLSGVGEETDFALLSGAPAGVSNHWGGFPFQLISASLKQKKTIRWLGTRSLE